MPKNRTKVESRAIDIIRDIVDDHPRLLPDPSFGDKGISFDGYIQLFKNEDVDKKENLLRQIPIQIKGRTEKNKKKVFMISGRKESVETDDIQNYYKHGGVIFFFVLFDKEFKEHSVFYSVLMPVKCKRYLELASTEKRKRIPVTFERMEETGNKMYELCAQFHAEQNKQGFGGGVLMEHVVNWGDLKGETTLTVSAVGAKSIDEILKRVVRGDVHFYAKEGSFSVPVAWREDSRFLKIIPYEHPVMIGKNKYFEHLNVGIDVNTKEHCLYLGNAITIEVSTAKFTLKKENVSVEELATASNFLLTLSEQKAFYAGSIALELKDLNVDEDSKSEFKMNIDISNILKTIGLDPGAIVYKEGDGELRNQLLLLWLIANHKRDEYLSDEITRLDWSIGGRRYPLVIMKKPPEESNDIFGLLSDPHFQPCCEGVSGEIYPIPAFVIPPYDIMKNLYSYDVNAFEEQIERATVNKETEVLINEGAMKLLSLYDTNQDERILQMAKKLIEKISSKEDPYSNSAVNLLQIKKRMGCIGSEEIASLRALSECGKQVLEFAAAVLLENKDIAVMKYSNLEESEKEELEETPIMTLYQRIQR